MRALTLAAAVLALSLVFVAGEDAELHHDGTVSDANDAAGHAGEGSGAGLHDSAAGDRTQPGDVEKHGDASEEGVVHETVSEEDIRRAAEEAARRISEGQASDQGGGEVESGTPAEDAAHEAAEEEAAHKAAEEEAARKASEEEAGRKAAEEEASRKAAEEEAARKAAEEEAARKAAEEEEAARKAAEEEAARKAVEEEAARKTAEEEEAARKAAEEEAARKAAEEEAARKAAEEEAARKAAEEEAARKAAEEEAARKAAEEEAVHKAAEDTAARAAEEATRKAAEEEAARKAAADAAARAAEEATRKAAEEEETVRQVIEEARRAAEERARKEAARKAAADHVAGVAKQAAAKAKDAASEHQSKQDRIAAAAEEARRNMKDSIERVEAKQRRDRAAGQPNDEAQRLAAAKADAERRARNTAVTPPPPIRMPAASQASPSAAPMPSTVPFPVEHGPAARKSSEFVCRRCGAPLFHSVDHMHEPPVSPAHGVAYDANPELGPDAQAYRFRNPNGDLHSVALFSAASGVQQGAEASSVASYFPPMHWRHLTCSSCNSHVGWAFTSQPAKPPASSKSSRAKVKASDSSKSVPRTAQSTRRVAKSYSESTEGAALSSLKGKCVTAPDGWWTYEWCHRKGVRQYHREANGDVTADWSLGKFDSTGRVTRAGRPSAAGYYTTHDFIDGQPCDELGGRGRRSEVHFFCCASNRPAAYIESFEETSVCKYRFTVCVPDLCEPTVVPPKPVPDTEDASKTPSATPAPGNHPPFFAALMTAVIGDASLDAVIGDTKYATGLNAPYFMFG